MTTLALTLAVLLSGTPDPTKSEAYQQQMSEAIRRHDGRDYDGAIEIYRSVLKTWPHDPTAVYELAFSMGAKGTPPQEMIDFIEGELKVMKKPLPQLYSSLGAAYDGLRQFEKGEAALRRGLKVDPKSADLAFNLGINLAMQHKNADAEAQFVAAAALAPNWSSVWRALSISFEADGRLIDAVLARLNFLMLEPGTDRSRAAAKAVDQLLDGLARRGDKKIDVSVGKDKSDLALQLTLAASFADEKKSSSEQTIDGLEKMIELALVKSTGVRATLLKRMGEAKKAKCLTAGLWEYRRAAGDPNADAWFGAHEDEEQRWDDFIAPQRRR